MKSQSEQRTSCGNPLPALALCLLLTAPSAFAQDLQWATSAGGLAFDSASGIGVDPAGNSYATGTFDNSATFGAGEANETTLVSGGGRDIYLAKFDTAGSLLWATKAGGTGAFESGSGMAIDGDGNILISGFFSDSATFGAGEVNETTLISAGGADIFVAKYDDDGSLLWARRAGGDSTDQGFSTAVDSAGNSCVFGSFNGSATFGSAEPNETTLVSAGNGDVFIAKFAGDGSLLWAESAGGNLGDLPGSVAADMAGHCLVTGAFAADATFGAGEPNETILSSPGGRDIFIAKYDTGDGSLLWAVGAVGASFNQGSGIAVDALGNPLVTGKIRGVTVFGDIDGGNGTILTSTDDSEDIFVAKYDSDGEFVWATWAGGTGADSGLGIAADGAGNSIVTGYFSGTATFFGPGSMPMLSSDGSIDVFIAKYAPDRTVLWARRAGGTSNDAGAPIALSAADSARVAGTFELSATFGPGEANETTLMASGSSDIFVASYADVAPPPDGDGDGVPDGSDNCPAIFNPLQDDSDSDDTGDVCDVCPLDATDSCDPGGSDAQEVTPADGGTVQTGDGLTLEFGPGDVGETTTIIVSRDDPADPEVDLVVSAQPGLGSNVAAWDFQPDGIMFDNPVLLTVVLDVSALNPMQRDNLDLYRQDDMGIFQALGASCPVAEDPPGVFTATCTVEIMHFTIYAAVVPLDTDGDGVPDMFNGIIDNCPLHPNPGQEPICLPFMEDGFEDSVKE